MEQRRMLHLGLLSDLKPYCPLPASPNTASLPWRKLTAAQVLLRVRLWSSPVCPCKQHAFGTSHPGASPALVMGYWTCRWEKESLRQELSLFWWLPSDPNGKWAVGTIPQKPLPQLAGSLENPGAMGGGWHCLHKSCHQGTYVWVVAEIGRAEGRLGPWCGPPLSMSCCS